MERQEYRIKVVLYKFYLVFQPMSSFKDNANHTFFLYPSFFPPSFCSPDQKSH